MAQHSDPSGTIHDRGSRMVAEAAGGNAEALSSLLEIARPLILRWASVRTRDPDDAEDVTQLVLLRLHSRISNFRGDSCLSSWLYRVTVNEAFGFSRRKSREQTLARVWKDSGSRELVSRQDTDSMDRRRLASAIKEAASTLPHLQKSTFQLVDLDGYRPCEAAIELGRTQTTIRSTLSRARKKIRELVEESQRVLASEYLEE